LSLTLIGQVFKKKYMSTTETKEKVLVWSKTERAGTIVVVDKTEGEFTYFKDGSKVFTNIIGEVLVEARDQVDAEKMAQLYGASVANATPVETVASTETVVETKATQPAGEYDVMLEMLRKVSAKNTISMPLELNIPSHEVYELFRDQMDITKEDLNNQILALVLSQIDNLQEQLKPQAQEFINKYYYGRKNKSTGGTKPTTGSAPDINF